MTRKGKRIAIAGVLLGGLVGAAAATGGFGESRPAQSASTTASAEARPEPVTAATVQQKAMPVELTAIGRVQTIASVAIRSRIDGTIDKVLIGDGQEVKAGQVLFQLDPRLQEAQLDQAKAGLARDQAQLANAKSELARQQKLASRDFATQQTLDQAKANEAALEASIKADEAQIENAQVQLSYTEIRAPFDGRAGTIALKAGNTVKALDTTSLVTINQLRPIYVAFSVPQQDLARIQDALAKGAVPIEAAVPGGGAEAGEVAYVENAVDASTNTVSIKARFANADERLWPGQFVNVAARLSIEPDAIVVPSTAVQIGQKGSYVFVIGADRKVAEQPVTVDRVVGDETVIAKGLQPGKKVVTSGQLRLQPGSLVSIAGAAAAGASS